MIVTLQTQRVRTLEQVRVFIIAVQNFVAYLAKNTGLKMPLNIK